MSLLDNLFTFSSQVAGYMQQTVTYLQTLATTVNDNKINVDIGAVEVDFSSTVADVLQSGTLAATNSDVTVAMQGRPYAGFAIGAGFTGTITFEASYDGGTSWSSVQTYTVGLPPTITAATLTPAGSAASKGIIVPLGATHVRARASSGAGSASATIRATVAGVMSVFPQLDTLHADLALITAAITASRLQVDLGATPTGNLATLAAAIVSSRMQVDLASTPTANLATLAGAITSARMAVNVDSTTQGKLDILHTDVGPVSTIYAGNKNVTTAGTPVALAASQALTRGIRMRGKDANTNLIYFGPSSVTSGSDRLAPGEPTWIDANNLANVYIDAAVSGEGVTFSAW